MKTFLAASALALSMATAAHAGDRYIAFGYGNIMCSQIASDPSKGWGPVEWIEGYISGLNSASANIGTNAAVGATTNLTNDQLYRLISLWCEQHPRDSLSDVANTMYSYLKTTNQ